MRVRLRVRVCRVTVFAVLFILLSANVFSASYPQSSSATVDVFTQQEPYSGKGPNMPSDAFGPQDLVILYALVTCSNLAVSNILVGFSVKMPDNANFDLSAQTNMSGIATVNFRIPTPSLNVSESDIFGTWIVTGSVLLDGEVYQDTLSFRVDWIVKLLSVKTTDANLTVRDHFGKAGDIGLVITLRSIAMTLRNATVAIVVKDELAIPVNFSKIQNFLVPPNGEVVSIYCKATLANTSFTGNANVTVSAFESPRNGTLVPYCPPISTTFMITSESPLKIDYYDAAVVTVLPSAKTIEVGQGLTLKTIVRTEGTIAENFNVTTYFDNVPLGSSEVTNLSPYSTATFQFTVDPARLTLGNHTVSASIPPVPREVNLTDNYFSSWVLVTPSPPVVHDVGITSIALSTHNAYIGDVVDIYVTVKNNGTTSESFSLSAYYNSSLIQTLQVSALTCGSQENVAFSWNTSTVSAGLYQIKAIVYLPSNETDASPLDNTLVDGFIQVMTPVSPVIHDVGITSITRSTHNAYIGDVVDIYVTVKNNGTEIESFDLSTHYNSSLIKTFQVTLVPDGSVTITFSWNTSTVSAGLYQISASAPVAGDASPGDNIRIDGFIQVQAHLPPLIDVAITHASLSSTELYIGQTLGVNVTAANLGSSTETFNVTVYRNGTAIEPPTTISLEPNAERTLSFSWDTTGASAGVYTIIASGSQVPGETNIMNNNYVAGQVKLIQRPPPFNPRDLYIILFVILLLFLLALLTLLVLRRRKTDESEILEQISFFI
jgi:hypothetical protein